MTELEGCKYKAVIGANGDISKQDFENLLDVYAWILERVGCEVILLYTAPEDGE